MDERSKSELFLKLARERGWYVREHHMHTRRIVSFLHNRVWEGGKYAMWRLRHWRKREV